MLNFVFFICMVPHASLIIVVVFPQFGVAMAIFALFSGVFGGIVAEFVATLVSSDIAGDVADLVDGNVAI